MTDREKLIDLLTDVLGMSIGYKADHLIQNGVTFATDNNVGHWIPVTKRLPESEKDPVLIALKWGSVDIGWCENKRWGSEFIIEYDNGEVTHWMPLPEPPKEVE